MSLDDVGHSSVLDGVAARLPEEYREAYLEGVARVHADRRRGAAPARRAVGEDVDDASDVDVTAA